MHDASHAVFFSVKLSLPWLGVALRDDEDGTKDILDRLTGALKKLEHTLKEIEEQQDPPAKNKAS